MDTEDTSSKADAAAVKRKRRSSILKNQRPPRTPFSEVEFNVTTPPDTTKSRRVSFSRRTGVAEFVTNEATTTWRNFYEEHNKSLESSGNENNLVPNAPRQIQHIGKRMFDQQFEEVEAVDVGGAIHGNPLQQFQASFNNINLTQQLASLECMTEDLKFKPSQSKFEQSALTELSKPFGNDIQCPVMEDMTNPISMNFSMQPLGSGKCDDLDEIQNDLERSKPNMCPGPMNPGKDFSGYIEVADLDVTRGVFHNDGSEMSITDTIESPKVQEAKNALQQSRSKLDDDWTNDKENMVFNPYIAPKESLTFAVNKVSDEVLVFDGKRLTTQSITSNIAEDKENYRQASLTNVSGNQPQRKTIILDVNDDLPNFIDNSKSNLSLHTQPLNHNSNKTDLSSNKSVTNNTMNMCDTSNISFTQAIPSNILAVKRESLHLKKDLDNLVPCNSIAEDVAIAQPVPNVIDENNTAGNGKRKTIIFTGESCDISMTQALQTNINFDADKITKSGMFDNVGDISFTQALPTNIKVNEENKDTDKPPTTEKRRTIIFDDASCDISITQAVPISISNMKTDSHNNLIKDQIPNTEKRRTIIFDHESCDISMTQVLPTNINPDKENIISNNLFDDNMARPKHSEKRNTIIFDKDSCDISMTQVLPSNINIENAKDANKVSNNDENKNVEKRRTIIFDKESCDISITQAIPTNINIIENVQNIEYDKIDKNLANNEIVEKRRTIIFDKDSCDISMTQAIPTNINVIGNIENNKVASNEATKRKTIIFDEESCDISMTQAIPTNINIENIQINNEHKKDENNANSTKRRTIIFDKDTCDISMTQALPTNIEIKENMDIESNNDVVSEKRKTILFDKDSCDISITQAIPTNINFDSANVNGQLMFEEKVSNENATKRKTVIFDNDSCDISMTQALPTNINIYEENLDNVKNNINLHPENSSAPVSKDSDRIPTTEAFSNKNEILDNIKSNSLTTEKFKEEVIKENAMVINTRAQENISVTNLNKEEKVQNNEKSSSDVIEIKMDVEDDKNENFEKDDGKQSVVNKSMAFDDIQKGDLLQGSQNDVHDKDCKVITSVSAYQTGSNKELNKSSAETEAPINIFKDKTFTASPRKSNVGYKPRPKKSILDELLSMSCDSVKNDLSNIHENDLIDNDNEMVKESVLVASSKEDYKNSGLVLKSENENNETVKKQEEIEIKNDSVIFMENQEITNTADAYESENSRPQCKSYIEEALIGDEKNEDCNMELDESVKVVEEPDSPKALKSVKEADNTKDLLKMLSDFTDEDAEASVMEQSNKSVAPEKIKVENVPAKKPVQELKRLSLAPRRQSIAISREDLLNNISMAKAALQQSRYEVDDTDIMDDTSELIETHEIDDKPNRMSTEVVKTLQFGDESASDTSVKSEVTMTPLRKSAVDELSSVNDKAKVIPTFLTEASVSLKELMHDLVKPNSDAPFDNFSETKEPSTCNVEIETNLITSSQIDVSFDVQSTCVLKNSDNFIVKADTKNVSQEVDSETLLNLIDAKPSVTDSKPIKILNETVEDGKEDIKSNMDVQTPPKSQRGSLVFSSDNPLKNVLLPPIDYADAHKYNEKDNLKQYPLKLMEVDENIHTEVKGEVKYNSFVKDNTDKKITKQMNIVCGKTASERSDAHSINTNVCKPTFADKSVESVVPSLKDTEVNTVIVMRENRDLIQSSSLTLVDEKLTDSEFKMTDSTEPSSEGVYSGDVSPVRILFKNENDDKFAEKDSVVTSSEEISSMDLDKGRKRSYSPSTSSYVSNVEVTPKPINKMQKMSNSPATKACNMEIDSPKNEAKKTMHTEIIQKVEIQYNSKAKSKTRPIKTSQSTTLDGEKVESKECFKKLSFSSDSAIPDPSVTISQVVSSVTSRIVPFEEERGKKHLEKEREKVEMDTGPDIVENLKKLSFMGTSECEWEQRRADAWSFRLLAGRLRVRVRLSAPACAADTPVAVDVEVAKHDEKDAIACLCARVACEALRYEAAAAARADAVGALLRRCVRVTRLARRWARAMRDAHVRLAYRVLPDGQIALKVANLPLRCVCEVRMHVSVCVASERGAAYPRADALTLRAGGAGVGLAGRAPPAELTRLADQPADWGHVPRTIWKVFKYLKNRTRQEELQAN